jgi:DNA polymerase IV
VTPDWLRGSMAEGRLLPCADYAALPDLKQANEGVCPSSSSLLSEKPSSKPKSRSPSLHSPPFPRAAHTDIVPPAFLLPPPMPPTPVELDHTARFCCSRASPLVCVNQLLCDALDILRRSRALESNERSVLSYARAIAVSVTLSSLILPLNLYAL